MRSGRRGLVVPLALAALLALGGCGDAVPSATVTPQPIATLPTSAPPSTLDPTERPGATPQSTPAPSASPLPTPTATASPAASPVATPVATPTPRPTPTPGLQVGRPAYVAVTVATGWHLRTSPRGVDSPALANPVRMREWLTGLSVDQQKGLIGSVETQVLLGDRVLVTELAIGWARVVVPDQATPLDRRGYPVWIPRRQLTSVAPKAAETAEVATVIVPTAWLETQQGARVAEASFGTSLPVLGRAGARVRLALPGGRTAWLPSASVSVRPRGAAALDPSGASVVATAKRFLGLRYVWGGTSGFGLDCSGIVFLVYRAYGVTLPRDADPQSRVGTAISAASRRPGDLLFFARDGEVHHVGIWVGGGMILEAPQVGSPVRVVALASLPYRSELTVTRRVLR